MKDEATIALHCKASGEVVGEIVNVHGKVVVSRSFGMMTDDEFRGCLNQIEKIFPEVAAIDVIELIGN